MNVAVGQPGWAYRPVGCHDFLPTEGRHIVNACGIHGVDTQHVVWDPTGRCGTYFIEQGAPRPTQVLYDRANSAFANLGSRKSIGRALDGAEVFLTSGITTAVCGLDITLEAITPPRKPE